MSKISQNNKEHIIFLPGWGFKASIWQSIGSNLKVGKITYCDLPKLAQDNNQLDIITQHLTEKISPNSTIIAWSLSGLIAIYLCHKYPGICKKLILVASAPKFTTITDSFITNAKNNITETFDQFLRTVQYPNHNAAIKTKLRNNIVNVEQEKISLLHYLNLLYKTDLSSILTKLTQPIFIIQGDQDPITPKIPHTWHTKTVQGAGHLPFLTNTQIFSTALQTFINS